MRPDLYTVVRHGSGRLATMARPRSGDWLEDEFQGLASSGITTVVSMLTDSEMIELGLTDEAAVAARAGVEFLRLPTADRQVPDRAALSALARELLTRLRKGQGVAVHCRNGIGRASTVAAAVLIMEGTEAPDAWSRIEAARGLPVPDTDEQRRSVVGFTA